MGREVEQISSPHSSNDYSPSSFLRRRKGANGANFYPDNTTEGNLTGRIWKRFRDSKELNARRSRAHPAFPASLPSLKPARRRKWLRERGNSATQSSAHLMKRKPLKYKKGREARAEENPAPFIQMRSFWMRTRKDSLTDRSWMCRIKYDLISYTYHLVSK